MRISAQDPPTPMPVLEPEEVEKENLKNVGFSLDALDGFVSDGKFHGSY